MCINPIKIIDKNGEEKTVSCGKCILCRYKRCRTWALRLYHESQYYNKMCMITLTFRPKFLLKPKIKTLTKYTTKKQHDGTKLKKKIKYNTMISPRYITDVRLTRWLVTLFIKKLRKKLSKQNKYISYFAVGEHGSQNTHRSHWHILFFGISKEELNSICIGKSKKNKDIFWSPIINELWAYDKMKIGQHTISDVTSATIKYVANYTMKKMYNNNKEQYPVVMQASTHNKIGLKWARKYHKMLRKKFLLDNDNIKYSIPKAYEREMLRYFNKYENYEMDETAIKISENKAEIIKKLFDNGMLSLNELKKKARRLENRTKRTERDTI